MINYTEYDSSMRHDITIHGTTVNVKSTQDVEPLLIACKEARDNEDKGKIAKETFHQYASIPPIIVKELMQKGINIFDNNCMKDLKREIETNYSYLKTTNLKGW